MTTVQHQGPLKILTPSSEPKFTACQHCFNEASWGLDVLFPAPTIKTRTLLAVAASSVLIVVDVQVLLEDVTLQMISFIMHQKTSYA